MAGGGIAAAQAWRSGSGDLSVAAVGITADTGPVILCAQVNSITLV